MSWLKGAGELTDIATRLATMEDTVHEYEIFESIGSGTTGTVTKPTHGTIILDQYQGLADCLILKMDSGRPIDEVAKTGAGVAITATFNVAGAYVMSGIPSAYPVAIVYQLQLAEKYKTAELSDTVILNETELVIAERTTFTDSVFDAKTVAEALDNLETRRRWLSAGAIVFPTYTDNGDGSITIGSDGVYGIYTSADASGGIRVVSVTGGTFTLTDQQKNFIYIYWNGGTPVMGFSIDPAIDGPKDYLIPLTIFRTGTVLHTIPWGAEGLALSEKLNEKEITLRKFQKDTGLTLSEIATRIIKVTEGKVYAGINYLTVAASRSDVNYTFFYYRTAGVWQTSLITQYNNSQYDNLTDLKGLALEGPNASTWSRSGTLATITLAGHNLTNGDTINVTVSSTLAAIPLGDKIITVTGTDTFTFTCNNSGLTTGTLTYTTAQRYAVNWIYRGVESQNHCYILLGNGNYTLPQAQSSVPDGLPLVIPTHAILVGKIIVKRAGTVATEIDQVTNVFLQASSVSNHQDLLDVFQAGSGVTNGHISNQSQTIEGAKTFTSDLILGSRIYGTALHNNAGDVTGTTKQYIASGTYTPTLVNIANCGTLTPYACQWMRVGNVVTVSGFLTVVATTINTATSFSMTLPIASSFSENNNCAGTSLSNTVGGGFAIYGNSNTDLVNFANYSIATDASSTWCFNFSYVIL